MNLQPINPPLHPGQVIQCCVCFMLKADVVADLDGEPFKAFYCTACRPDNFDRREETT